MSIAQSLALDAATFLVTVFFVMAPGAIVLRAINWQGWAYCATPVVTYGCVVLGMNIDDFTGIGWSPLTLLLATAILALAGWGASRWRLPGWGLPDDAATLEKWSTPRATGWSATRIANITLWATMLVAGCFGTAVIVTAMGSLTNMHQDWDAAFHGSTTRLIGDLATTDLDALGEVLRPQDPEAFFYPAAWHALTALGEWVPGIGVPRLMNVSVALIPFFGVFALGGLVRVWTGSTPLAIVSALILPWSASFPYDVLWRGPLIPYAYGMALLPAICLLMLKLYTTRSLAGPIVLGAGAAGMVVLHPSMALMATVFMLALSAHRWVMTCGKTVLSDLTALVITGIVAIPFCLTVLIGAMDVTSTSGGMDWPAYKNKKEALFAVLTDSNWDRSPDFVAPLFGLLALALGWRYLHRWVGWTVVALFFAWLYILAAAVDSDFVQSMTGFWWNDAYRLISVVWLIAPVIVACGVVATTTLLGGWLTRRLDRTSHNDPANATPAAFVDTATAEQTGNLQPASVGTQQKIQTAIGAAVILGMFFATGLGNAHDTVKLMNHKWHLGAFVDEGEQQAYAKLPEQLGSDAYVLNDPNDGSPWLYTIAGVNEVFLFRLSDLQRPFMSENEKIMIDKFRDIDTDPEVQQAVQEMGLTHLVLGTPSDEMAGRPPGLQNIPDSDWLTPVPYDTWPLEVWEITPPTE